MPKKKRAALPPLEEVLNRPWCWYCEKDFDDLQILVLHQKQKHFRCESCNRKLNTAGGLSVHSNQVHKEPLNEIKNALPNRTDPNIEIFGMEGIPTEDSAAHQKSVTEAYFRFEADWRAKTGNNPSGSEQVANPTKKKKTETPEEMKQRLAEHKARKAAEKAAASNPTTPANSGGFEAVGLLQSHIP